MRAIRYYGPGDIRLDEIPEPTVGPKQVKVRVAWNGICGSDRHLYHELPPEVCPTTTEPHPVTNETLPVGMGHEFSGTVVELGPEADTDRLAIGQHVAIEPIVTCMKPDCPDCSSAHTRNLCSHVAFIGLSGGGGGLAEYTVVDQRLAHVLPPGISLEVGAMMEPLAVAWHAVKKSNVKSGDTALILGAGPIAIMILKVLRLFDAGWIGVSGRAAKRCELVQQHGASAVFNVAKPDVDVVAETMRATHGRGADIVFDCGGSQTTLDTALGAVRRGGTIMNVAGWTDMPRIDMQLMLYKEIVLASSLGYAGDHPDMLQAIAEGKLADLETLVTRRIPMEQLVEKGIKALIHEKNDHVKILVHP